MEATKNREISNKHKKRIKRIEVLKWTAREEWEKWFYTTRILQWDKLMEKINELIDMVNSLLPAPKSDD